MFQENKSCTQRTGKHNDIRLLITISEAILGQKMLSKKVFENHMLVNHKSSASIK